MAAEAPKKHSCEICWEEFHNNVQCTPCFHKFHIDCIKRWINQHDEMDRVPCPICKTDISQIKHGLGLEDTKNTVDVLDTADEESIDENAIRLLSHRQYYYGYDSDNESNHHPSFPPQIILPVEKRPNVLESKEPREISYVAVEPPRDAGNLPLPDPFLELIEMLTAQPIITDQDIAQEIKEDKSSLEDVIKHLNR